MTKSPLLANAVTSRCPKKFCACTQSRSLKMSTSPTSTRFAFSVEARCAAVSAASIGLRVGLGSCGAPSGNADFSGPSRRAASTCCLPPGVKPFKSSLGIGQELEAVGRHRLRLDARGEQRRQLRRRAFGELEVPGDAEIHGAQARRDRVVLAHRLGVHADQADVAHGPEAVADAQAVAVVGDDAHRVEGDAPRCEQRSSVELDARAADPEARRIGARENLGVRIHEDQRAPAAHDELIDRVERAVVEHRADARSRARRRRPRS